MNTTKLKYLEDFNLLELETKVMEVNNEDGRDIIILEETVFYPQGGGQPYDQGIIESSSGKFLVIEVRFIDGIVKHIGNFESGKFSSGEIVKCEVDQIRRKLNSRLHSGGHIVDMAVNSLGLKWNPGKGYHFPDGPYVEYIGSLEGLDKEKLKTDIEKFCNKFVEEDRKTELRFIPKEEMSSVCHFVPDYIPEGKPARVVMYGDFGVPCGGTHVNNLREVGNMIIRKIRDERGNIRVGYDVER